jgi:peroxiredoxin
MSRDVHALPPDLPVPRDDGAARGLPGRELPPLRLEATRGGAVDLRDAARDLLVLYVYPRTGGPGIPDVPGWDEIPGARGCTPENCAFRDHARELAELGATVHGLSAQPLEEQREFAERERIPYALLNDSALDLVTDPGLPTFEAGELRLYRRLTLIARAGRIEHVFYPVFPPDAHASEVLSWLRAAA